MNFLGDNLLAWLVLALGGALAVGSLLALVRQQAPVQNEAGDKTENAEGRKAPLVRSILMIVLGTVASIWALASLLTSNNSDDAASVLAYIL